VGWTVRYLNCEGPDPTYCGVATWQPNAAQMGTTAITVRTRLLADCGDRTVRGGGGPFVGLALGEGPPPTKRTPDKQEGRLIYQKKVRHKEPTSEFLESQVTLLVHSSRDCPLEIP